jgi:hypothetical protein
MNDAAPQTEDTDPGLSLIDPKEFGPADIAGNPPESIADPPAPGGGDAEPGDEDNHGDPEAGPTS